MLVPAGVSKGTGLFEALGDLGISRHSTLAVGDAENDHSLLAACELGVAVADAVASLKEAADVVLPEAGSAGLARFLLGPAVLSDETPEPRRFQAVLGTYEDGSAAKVPASGVNVLVTGGTMSGKSHLTGLLAERLLGLGYSLCVLDPEGDHVSLGRMRGVLTVGGNEPLPGPEQLPRLIEHRFRKRRRRPLLPRSPREAGLQPRRARGALGPLERHGPAALALRGRGPGRAEPGERAGGGVRPAEARDLPDDLAPRAPPRRGPRQPRRRPRPRRRVGQATSRRGPVRSGPVPGRARRSSPAAAVPGPRLHRRAPVESPRETPPQVQRPGPPVVPALHLPRGRRGGGPRRTSRSSTARSGGRKAASCGTTPSTATSRDGSRTSCATRSSPRRSGRPRGFSATSGFGI